LTILVKSPPKDSPEDLILGRLTVDKRLMEAYQRGQAGPGERGDAGRGV